MSGLIVVIAAIVVGGALAFAATFTTQAVVSSPGPQSNQPAYSYGSP